MMSSVNERLFLFAFEGSPLSCRFMASVSLSLYSADFTGGHYITLKELVVEYAMSCSITIIAVRISNFTRNRHTCNP